MHSMQRWTIDHGFVQDCSNSSVLAMQSCTKLSINALSQDRLTISQTNHILPLSVSYGLSFLSVLTYWSRVMHLSVNWPSLVQTMACRLAGAKPLSEQKLEYC